MPPMRTKTKQNKTKRLCDVALQQMLALSYRMIFLSFSEPQVIPVNSCPSAFPLSLPNSLHNHRNLCRRNVQLVITLSGCWFGNKSDVTRWKDGLLCNPSTTVVQGCELVYAVYNSLQYARDMDRSIPKSVKCPRQVNL